MRKEVERLILQARRDLENARKNIKIGAYEVAAFLSHQTVEQYLKGAWIQKKRARPPATLFGWEAIGPNGDQNDQSGQHRNYKGSARDGVRPALLCHGGPSPQSSRYGCLFAITALYPAETNLSESPAPALFGQTYTMSRSPG